MAEELAHLRFAEMESRMNQMAELINEMKTSQTNQLAFMMADMKELILANRVEPNNPAEINPANPVLAEEIKEEPVEEVRLGRDEVPLGVLPGIVIAEGSKVKSEEVKAKETARLAKIEQCLARQGYEIDRFDSISPYAKVQVPDNYKEPEFPNRYDGTDCPKSHLKYYLRKMARYSDNAPLLISTFQDSLQGAALVWYVALDVEDYQSWDELASAFLRQYRFNVEALPTREDLVQTKKGTNESFKTYSQRWKAVASQVKPTVQENELMELFLRSLPDEYYEKMYVSGSPSFNQLLMVGERVERRFKEKQTLQDVEEKLYPSRKGNEASTETAFVSYAGSGSNFKPKNQMRGVPRVYEPRKKAATRQYTPLPRSLSKLLPMLLEGRLVAKEMARDPPPKFFGSDPSKSCEYHMGEKGHDVDNCLSLKNRVQDLIDRDMLDFKEAGSAPEPLPN